MSELLQYFLGRVRGLVGNAVFFHTHQEEPTEAAVPESYEDWRDGFAKERLLIFYSVALISNPVWVALDYLHGSQFFPLVTYRAIFYVAWILGFWRLRYPNSTFELKALLVVAVLVPNLCIAEMTVVLGEFHSQYYNGLTLLLLAGAVIVPVYWKTHLLIHFGTLLSYLGLQSFQRTLGPDWTITSEIFMFLVWVSICLLVSVFLYERLQRSEFQARISERSARLELEQSNNKLQEMDRLKSEFFANVSHELRTPLTLSLGAFTTLQKQWPAPDCHEVIRSGLRNTSRLLFLINELLDLARFEGGQRDVQKQYLDFGALVRSVVANFESGEGRVLQADGLHQTLPLEANAGQMKKMLYNLLSNAFKFTNPSHRQIGIRLQAGENSVQLVIHDNGIGIPSDHVTRIFDRFTQVEGAATRRYEGTGIGLALVKEIVTGHGGRINVKSTVGKGSTFTVTLPRGQATNQNVLPLDGEEETFFLPTLDVSPLIEKEISSPSPPSCGRDCPSILVVDDNPDMRQYLSHILNPFYRIVSAQDGDDAFRRGKEFHPDLILTDVMMPHMSGIDLLHAIRQDQDLHSIPVVFLTARAGIEARVESLEASADEYITKPFNEAELLARIHNQFRLRHQERELEARAVEFQQLNEQLEVANTQLNALNVRKSEFVSIVAHELRTPLTSVAGLVENMIEGLVGGLTDKQHLYLHRIKVNLERLTRMITELLDLSRIEAGQIELAPEPLNIHSFVELIVENLKPLAHKKGIHMQAMAASSLPMIWGDPDKLTQIMTNLIQNATKFTPEGGTIKVVVQMRDDGFVQIMVADTGCGIPVQDQGKVFEKFYRGQASLDEVRGAGLGLSIVKQLVELHQGHIWVVSAIGEGSRFFFTVPAASHSDRI